MDKKTRLNEPDYQALVIKAWNGHVQGKTIPNNSLRWRSEGKQAEAFPTPIL